MKQAYVYWLTTMMGDIVSSFIHSEKQKTTEKQKALQSLLQVELIRFPRWPSRLAGFNIREANKQ